MTAPETPRNPEPGENDEVKNPFGARRSRQRLRTLVFIVLLAVLLVVLSLRNVAEFLTDLWWFESLGFRSIWQTKLITQIGLSVTAFAIFFTLAFTNIVLAQRLAPEVVEPSPENDALMAFRAGFGKYWNLVRVLATGLFAISISIGAKNQWENALLFVHGKNWGTTDPHFGVDLSFFVFKMPFLSYLSAWLFSALSTVLVLTLIAHYIAGGIRIQNLGDRATPAFKRHISVLLAAVALVKSFDYVLQRYALAYSTDGRFAGLGYVDVEARIGIFSLLASIAVLVALALVVNIKRTGWALPAIAIALWAGVSFIMTQIYPQALQRLSVDPDETLKEAPYISRNIEATKAAYGLDLVDQRVFDYSEDLIGADLQTNADNVAAVPILDPAISAKTFQLQQAERSFFRFPTDSVDVGRYMIDGTLTPVVISARELNLAELPEGGWESEVLSYTHGNGIALAPSNRVSDNLPDFLIGDVPMDNRIEDDLNISQPRTYFGETMRGYAIINTDRDEVDSLEGGTRVPYNYQGSGGVAAGGRARRAMFSLKFGAIDPLISNFVRPDSRFIWNRNVATRVHTVAPFLKIDSDPYPVIADGRLVYVVDAYTTTSYYPYAQPRKVDGLSHGSGLFARHNYVRNSVKAVVDTYEGSVTLYVVDETDPIIRAWSEAFPAMFEPYEQMSEQLVESLRYPRDIFTIQTNMWEIYHIDSDETADLLEGSDEWSVAQDPGGVTGAESRRSLDSAGQVTESEKRVDPYYTLMRLPDEKSQHFMAVRTFVPFSKGDAVKQLQAIMVGVSEPGDVRYGRLVSYEVDNARGDEHAPAPALVASQITSQDQISERISLLNAKDEGSSVEFGELIVLPVQDSLVYVRPLYVIATGTRQPNLEWVIMAHADRVVMCHSMAGTIHALFGVSVEGVDESGPDPECLGDVVYKPNERPRSTSPYPVGRTSSGVQQIEIGDASAAEEALKLLEQADEALEAGDLGTYQLLVDTAKELLLEALKEE